MTERERFEAWWRDQHGHGPRRDSNDGYLVGATRRLWEAWQASSASSNALVRQMLQALEEAAERLGIHMQHTEDLIAHMKAHKAVSAAREHLKEQG